MTLLAEVRTESTLPFHNVTAPNWSNPGPFGAAHEWYCSMTWDQITQLQTFLKTPVAPTQTLPEALIDQTMRELGIGFYLGTFIGQGQGGSEIRMLFAYTPNMDVEEICKVWAALLQNPTPEQKPASDALTGLRQMWNAASNNSESGLMLLSEVDVDGKLADPTLFPFASIDKPR
ncbi:hypothetical protein DYH55_09920 [Methylovirgula sp. 4M-Z18]|nr:hypothetical protein DYH55_09920 [Methylovirgula sp. 4M-Z18]